MSLSRPRRHKVFIRIDLFDIVSDFFLEAFHIFCLSCKNKTCHILYGIRLARQVSIARHHQLQWLGLRHVFDVDRSFDEGIFLVTGVQVRRNTQSTLDALDFYLAHAGLQDVLLVVAKQALHVKRICAELAFLMCNDPRALENVFGNGHICCDENAFEVAVGDPRRRGRCQNSSECSIEIAFRQVNKVSKVK